MAEKTAHGPGRPRDERVDQAILDATIELLEEVGLHGTTVGAVAKRARVARATVYLRWPTHDALIAAAARHSIRRAPFTLTGDIAADLRTGAAYAVGVFREPTFVALFPELVTGVLAKPPAIDFNAVAVNRNPMAENYRQHAAEQGFRPDVDPSAAFDLILGLHIVNLLANGRGASLDVANAVAEVVIAGLRQTG
jgi:AcrR family transcriptional regulator